MSTLESIKDLLREHSDLLVEADVDIDELTKSIHDYAPTETITNLSTETSSTDYGLFWLIKVNVQYGEKKVIVPMLTLRNRGMAWAAWAMETTQ